MLLFMLLDSDLILV